MLLEAVLANMHVRKCERRPLPAGTTERSNLRIRPLPAYDHALANS